MQHERDDWVTSLVNVYEARPDRPSLHYNIAVTTHEHILVDNILRVVGHETHCLAPIPSHGLVAWYLQLPLRRGQPLAGRSGYGISLQIWQFRLADYLPSAAASSVPQQGPMLLQPKTQKRIICLDDALVEESEVSQQTDSVPSYAVRLRAGDLHSQVPSIVEIHGEPTENKIVDELKHWGHDCFVFQFAGHHEFLCLSRDRIPDDSLQHYIFGTSDGTDPNAAFLHSHQGEVLQELDCMKLLHSLGYFKTTIQEITQCLPDVFKVTFVHQVSTLDPGSLNLRLPTPWPDRISGDLRQQPKPSFCLDELPDECGSCRLRLGVELDTLATFFSSEEFPLCTTFEGLQIPPSTAMAPHFDWSTSCSVQDVERIVIYTDGSSLSHLRHQPQHSQMSKECLILGHLLHWVKAIQRAARSFGSLDGKHNRCTMTPTAGFSLALTEQDPMRRKRRLYSGQQFGVCQSTWTRRQFSVQIPPSHVVKLLAALAPMTTSNLSLCSAVRFKHLKPVYLDRDLESTM